MVFFFFIFSTIFEMRKVRELLDQKASQPCWQDMSCALEGLVESRQYNENKPFFTHVLKHAIEYLRESAPEACRLRDKLPNKRGYRVPPAQVLATLRKKIEDDQQAGKEKKRQRRI